LCRAEMSVRRHKAIARLGSLPRKRLDKGGERLLERRDAPPQVQTEIERHLLVARSSRVQPPSRIAKSLDEQPLDEAVYVFIKAGDEGRIRAALLENVGQRLLDLTRIFEPEHAGLRESPRPCQ